MSKPAEHLDGPRPYLTPMQPILPDSARSLTWGRLYGESRALAIARAVAKSNKLVVVIMPDMQEVDHLEAELRFFLDDETTVLTFPDWETLPYDAFSPHQDIVSQRLETLYRMPETANGLLLLPVSTLMQRVVPSSYLSGSTVLMDVGEKLDLDSMRRQLELAGYHCVSQVMEHGEFAVRGSLLDLFPMGSPLPYRIDLFDDEIETIRTFDPDTQRSVDKVDSIRLLPAREFPLDEAAIGRFRQAFRIRFEGDPQRSTVYRDVSQGLAPNGGEYYLPLFFDNTASLFDYLPDNSLMIEVAGTDTGAEAFWTQVQDRYEQRRYDQERPVLTPDELFLSPAELDKHLADRTRIRTERVEQEASGESCINFGTRPVPDLSIKARAAQPAGQLLAFAAQFEGRVLFTAESPGHREHLFEVLGSYAIKPRLFETWHAFLTAEEPLGITIAPFESGFLLDDPLVAVVPETRLLGDRPRQVQRRKAARDPETLIRDLTDLLPGAPVVHEDHGVGRYLGLQKLAVGDIEAEFLNIEYAGGDKLYVPVASLHLISRYTGAAPDHAPLHKLGGDQWARARRRAAEKVRDVAAELLEINARRMARHGHAFDIHTDEYGQFAGAFPFEETEDQQTTIDSVLDDLATQRPMDRVVCGDVGFGKTEVAMRAAFVAAQAGKQVAILVPTTLLAQQHFQNFRDRMADWPISIEVLSRFRSKKEQDTVLHGLEKGSVDVVIGTHKILQSGIKFKKLGLVIVDEEHRFGVRQKERLKALRAEVDLLTLTATPIPRTLNMSIAGLRDLSIIATPPAHRMAIKTFVGEWHKQTIRDACLREIKRGGQVYFLHNEVESIERTARELGEIVPEATIKIGHGQMRERDLEQVMLDFYHKRFNILVCTTIIESGIDVPTANTIIINRADRLGLGQLHQLRGRVGRSHHRAYAYLVAPPRRLMTVDAIKRLEAIESMEELGSGFTLATHDLEIRGAGELLGEEQSGQIHEVGFTLYTELLERTVRALKAGRDPELDRPLDHGAEIDLHIPSLIPDDYLPDVHSRLIQYKRIASAANEDELRDLQVEMIDRFGLLPASLKNLFTVTALKLKAMPLGIRKIEAGQNGGRLLFHPKTDIDPARIVELIQTQPQVYKLDGGDKLRFAKSMPDGPDRVSAVASLLDHLTMDTKAA